MSVLITGASSGIGLALAKHYAKSTKVIACGRNPEKIEKHFAEFEQVTRLCFDVSVKAQVLASAEQVQDLDVLVLNAGDCEYMDTVLPFDSDKFERVVKVNLLGLGYCLEAFLDKLKPGGQLVIISSSAILTPFPRAQAYGSSKAAASYLARSLAVDLVEHNIDVTLVEPGFVKTPLTDKNDFDMPFLVTLDRATDVITSGIEKRRSLVRFPSKLMFMLHLLACFPVKWLAKILKRN